MRVHGYYRQLCGYEPWSFGISNGLGKVYLQRKIAFPIVLMNTASDMTLIRGISREQSFSESSKEGHEAEQPSMFELLQAAISNPDSADFNGILQLFGTATTESTMEDGDKAETIAEPMNNNMMDTDETSDSEASHKYNNRRGSKPKEQERLRQMAKNREYARKCVQKKKDQRREAEIRCKKMTDEMEFLITDREVKTRNADFAVFLATSAVELSLENLENEKKTFEEKFKNAQDYWKRIEASDETVNVNYHQLEVAKEEFNKASSDLRQKNGVIGTLGSRKIRAKQHMEWRNHLYNLSILEHHLNREKDLATLADEYVKSAVTKVTKLLPLDGNKCSISKQLLDKLIKLNRGAQLAEFVQFVQRDSELFQENVAVEETKNK
uniref:BZIP domain-containing protein n=2 Tax=Caenorhabditis japonica TaxID=281687 RepID=A0A8R1I5U5_CAEJA